MKKNKKLSIEGVFLNRFREKRKLNEYCAVSILADDDNGVISKEYKALIKRYFQTTIALPQNYKLTEDKGVLYALWDANGEIIGITCISEDSHFVGHAEIRLVAVREKDQGKGYGLFMMREVEKKIAKHCDFEYLILSTDGIEAAAFYKKCGMKEAGKVKVGGYMKYFFAKKIDRK
ncbi:MAG: GNAT family N-acetyltransferase [Lactobacillales bacterium]|jgi:N-acetylglutamate synthase-like GNAT family acetyltransferase|nr:GNAT family N-acetyltransferase [Lactobacillales bacterium]